MEDVGDDWLICGLLAVIAESKRGGPRATNGMATRRSEVGADYFVLGTASQRFGGLGVVFVC